MEKYKFIVKLGQIKDLIAKGQDEKAIELAETVDFKKVKNIEDLGNIAALFLKNGMLLKARECYLELYDRVANRNTVMQLINLALRLKRPNEAEKYLREYQKIDKNDFYGLIFRYNIDKLEGKPYKELIPTLERLKKKEYIEAWAYELAKLYHKAGEVEKCIAECDDLIVFFGEGDYVERAKALKEYYEKEGGREAREKERAEKEAAEKAKKEELAEENARAVEEAFAKHDAGDPDVTELTSEEEVTEIEEEMTLEEEAAETEEEMTLEEEAAETEEEMTPEEEAAETEEEMTLEEEAAETEEEMTLEEEAAETEEEMTLEEEAAETEEEMTLEEEAAETEEEMTLEEDTAETEEEMTLEEDAAEAGEEKDTETSEGEQDTEEEKEARIRAVEKSARVRRPVLDKDDRLLLQLLREEGIEQPTEIIEEDMILEDEEETAAEETAESAEESLVEDMPESEEEEAAVEEEPEIEDESLAEDEPESEEEEATVEEEPESAEESIAEDVPENEEEEAAVEEEPEIEDESSAEDEPENEEAPVTFEFSEEGLVQIPARSRLAAFLQKTGSELDDHFGYLAYINDIRAQIIKALELILNPSVMIAGIAVTGTEKGDMINIIKGIAKIESKSGLLAEASCALAPAEKINKMDLEAKVSKLIGRCLMIEGAGALDDNAVESLMRISEKYGRKLGIILADSRSAIMNLLRDHRDLNSILPVRIHISAIDEDDVCDMVRYTIMKGGYAVTRSVEEEIISVVRGMKADPASRYAEAQRFINAVTDAADRRMTGDYLAATAEGRRAAAENMIESEDIKAAGY